METPLPSYATVGFRELGLEGLALLIPLYAFVSTMLLDPFQLVVIATIVISLYFLIATFPWRPTATPLQWQLDCDVIYHPKWKKLPVMKNFRKIQELRWEDLGEDDLDIKLTKLVYELGATDVRELHDYLLRISSGVDEKVLVNMKRALLEALDYIQGHQVEPRFFDPIKDWEPIRSLLLMFLNTYGLGDVDHESWSKEGRIVLRCDTTDLDLNTYPTSEFFGRMVAALHVALARDGQDNYSLPNFFAGCA
jgi:hypothetical protein